MITQSFSLGESATSCVHGEVGPFTIATRILIVPRKNPTTCFLLVSFLFQTLFPRFYVFGTNEQKINEMDRPLFLF